MSKNKASESYGPLVNEALKHRISIERMPNKKPLKVNLEESLISDIHSSSKAQIISPLIISEASSETLSDDAKTPSNLMQEDYNFSHRFLEMKTQTNTAIETTIETPKIIEKEEHPLVKQYTSIKESNNPIWIKKSEIVERNKDGVMQRTAILVHPNHPDDESYNITLTKIKGGRTEITYGKNVVAVVMPKDTDGKPTLIVGSHEHGTYHIQSPEDFKNLPAPLLSRVNVTTALAQKLKAGLGLSS